ncbi:hypothetical protein L9F63_020205 [Diploptera punctata]|uniref:Ionotropic glutamate receptor C-terminal domain-containing protein n=1 Tax=Diploptera punctata TaxID=6984 RepID=A0AAD7ZSL6_DIPPU|nr:hypothetical protein L9F63_020205 [Diploptera punctata]
MSRYYTEVYTWIVPRSALHPHWSNITKIYKFETWLLIISSLIFISTIIKYINTSKNNDIFKCIFISWGVFLNIPVDEISKKTTVRIIFITWILISIALTLIFQTFMTSYFTDPGKMYQMNTFAELEESNLLLGFTDVDRSLSTFLINTSKPKVLMFDTDCQMLNFCSRNSSVAQLITEERFLYVSQLYFSAGSTSIFHKFTEGSVSFHRTLHVHPRNPFVDAFNNITNILVDAGIVNKIVETFTDPSGWIRGKILGKSSIHDYVPLCMFHMTSPFMFLVIGYLLSTAVFIIEIIVSNFSDVCKMWLFNV